VSAVLYLLISAVVVIVVLEGGIPIIKKMQDKALFTKKRAEFTDLAQQVEQLSKEEQGSQRIIPLEVEKGSLRVEDDKIKWVLDTNAEILEPGSKISVGDVNILSNADVKAYWSEEENAYIIENSYVKFNFARIGSHDEWQDYSTADIIKKITLKPTSAELPGNFRFYLDNNAATANGNGYTWLSQEGSNLDKASLYALMNSSENVTYTLKLTLYADTDYIIPSVEMS